MNSFKWDVYEWGKVSQGHDKWQIKLLSEFFPNSYLSFDHIQSM